jgi:hypothetical protein
LLSERDGCLPLRQLEKLFYIKNNALMLEGGLSAHQSRHVIKLLRNCHKSMAKAV